MRAIFSGGKAIFDVYAGDVRQAIISEAGAYGKIISLDEIRERPDEFADTEYIFSTWGMFRTGADEIAHILPSLRAVFYGAGSVKYFAAPFFERNIRVFSARGANAIPVAEYTTAQIVLAGKGFYLAARRCRSPASRKNAREYFRTMPGNFGCSVGVIGAGTIGRKVLERLKEYDVRTLVYDPFISGEEADALGARRATLEEIFSTCQTISNHVPDLPQTAGIFGYGLFRLMKDNAVFINTGRGAQVIEPDLIRVLREKPDVTAVLDVTMPEPPEAGSELYNLENVVLTPHIAGSSGNELARMGEYMLRQFRKMKKGEPCECEITADMLATMA